MLQFHVTSSQKGLFDMTQSFQLGANQAPPVTRDTQAQTQPDMAAQLAALQQQLQAMQASMGQAPAAHTGQQAPSLPPPESYPVNDKHKQDWDILGQSFADDTAIARAWRRLLDRDIDVGPPMGEEYESTPTLRKQRFLNAVASLDTSTRLDPASGKQVPVNVNNTVEFRDARGIVGSESGI